jgi:hypothetical protein
MDRHTRQTRLIEVGSEGQAWIARAEIGIPGQGLAAEMAARYLAGAGVAALRVREEAAAAAARAVDSSVAVVIDPSLPQAPGSTPLVNQLLDDPSARAAAEGALFALRALRDALASRSVRERA